MRAPRLLGQARSAARCAGRTPAARCARGASWRRLAVQRHRSGDRQTPRSRPSLHRGRAAEASRERRCCQQRRGPGRASARRGRPARGLPTFAQAPAQAPRQRVGCATGDQRAPRRRRVTAACAPRAVQRELRDRLEQHPSTDARATQRGGEGRSLGIGTTTAAQEGAARAKGAHLMGRPLRLFFPSSRRCEHHGAAHRGRGGRL